MLRRHLPRALSALLVVTLLTPALALKKGQAPDVQRVSNYGRIDWGKGVLSATGLGAINPKEPNAAKAYLRARTFAKLDALRNLLMVVDHVRIDSQTVGSDFEANDRIRAEVQGILRGAQIVGEREIRVKGDTMVEVTVATNLYGDKGIANIFVPEVARHEPELAPAPEPEFQPAPQPRQEPEFRAPRNRVGIGVAPVIPPPTLPRERRETLAPPNSARPYTSVIIDTRGLRIERSMSPKIRRQDGSEIWGTLRVNSDFVIEQGIVVYARTLEEARRIDRCGNNPLILRAVARGPGNFPSDAILSDADAELLLAVNYRDGFLNRFNVIFVVDPARPLP